MDSKAFFKLTACTLDRMKTYFQSRDPAVRNQSMALEKRVIDEIVRVAIIKKEIYDFIMSDCPFIANEVKKEMNKRQQAQQQSLFNQ